MSKLILPFLCAVSYLVAADPVTMQINDFFPESEPVAKEFEASCCCKRGRRGSQGPMGPPGPAAQEINAVIEVTSTETVTVTGLVPFTSPIVFPANGVPSNGDMTLIESIPASGNFDTITLPLEPADTVYLVSYGVSVGLESLGEFQLVLNGAPLPYTAFGVDIADEHIMKGRTSVIVNPANTAGTLSLSSLEATEIDPATPNSFSAYISVVKLTQNSG